jgi:hypothetical protein
MEIFQSNTPDRGGRCQNLSPTLGHCSCGTLDPGGCFASNHHHCGLVFSAGSPGRWQSPMELSSGRVYPPLIATQQQSQNAQCSMHVCKTQCEMELYSRLWTLKPIFIFPDVWWIHLRVRGCVNIAGVWHVRLYTLNAVIVPQTWWWSKTPCNL